MYPERAKVYFLSESSVRRPLSWYNLQDIPQFKNEIAKTGFLRLKQDFQGFATLPSLCYSLLTQKIKKKGSLKDKKKHTKHRRKGGV